MVLVSHIWQGLGFCPTSKITEVVPVTSWESSRLCQAIVCMCFNKADERNNFLFKTKQTNKNPWVCLKSQGQELVVRKSWKTGKGTDRGGMKQYALERCRFLFSLGQDELRREMVRPILSGGDQN